MLMKAFQVTRPRALELKEIPVPQLSPEYRDGILVKTICGLTCGSDIPFFIGSKRSVLYPLAPGAPVHECVGEVVDCVSKEFRRGDKVLSIPDGNQGLAEYFLAPTTKTVLLNPETLDFGAACIIQPLSTVMNGVDRLGSIKGKSAVVVGLGPIGLLFCWLLKKGGASTVIGIDPIQERCQIAETLGATQTICCRSIEAIHEARIHPGWLNPPDICIEAVGHQTETINDCLELVRKNGTVVAFGVPDQPVYAFQYEIFFRKNATLIGTVTPDWKEYLTKARELYVEQGDELLKLITHRFAIHDAAKAFALYERHEDGIIKAVIDARIW